jgi:hypothetical protein
MPGYAINTSGNLYGEELSPLTTKVALPNLTTTPLPNNGLSAYSGGIVSEPVALM